MNIDRTYSPRRPSCTASTSQSQSSNPLCLLPTVAKSPVFQACSEQHLSKAAVSAARNQRYDRALSILRELIERYPYEPKHYCNRGLVYMRKKSYELALADFNQAIELNPGLDRAYNNRANAHFALGQTARALEDYERAIDYNPLNVRARINYGVTLRDLGCFDQALAKLD